MGTTRDDGSQQSMRVSAADLPREGHPFYERLNRIREAADFDATPSTIHLNTENFCPGG